MLCLLLLLLLYLQGLTRSSPVSSLDFYCSLPRDQSRDVTPRLGVYLKVCFISRPCILFRLLLLRLGSNRCSGTLVVINICNSILKTCATELVFVKELKKNSVRHDCNNRCASKPQTIVIIIITIIKFSLNFFLSVLYKCTCSFHQFFFYAIAVE